MPELTFTLGTDNYQVGLEQAAALCAYLKDGWKKVPATLEYSNGEVREVKRLAVSTNGTLIEMLHNSQRRGWGVSTIGLTSVTLHTPKPKAHKTRAQAYADMLRRYRDYFNKYASPNLWANIREGQRLVTDEKLAELAALDCSDVYAAARELGLPSEAQNGFKTTTLKSSEAPEWIIKAVAEAVSASQDFSYSWRGRYDYRVSGKACDDGVYRAWLSWEYKGCGNGHYYLLISPTRAVFCEDD